MRHPDGNRIDIYFELYLHTSAGPAESATLANDGGPGPPVRESAPRDAVNVPTGSDEIAKTPEES